MKLLVRAAREKRNQNKVYYKGTEKLTNPLTKWFVYFVRQMKFIFIYLDLFVLWWRGWRSVGRKDGGGWYMAHLAVISRDIQSWNIVSF